MDEKKHWREERSALIARLSIDQVVAFANWCAARAQKYLRYATVRERRLVVGVDDVMFSIEGIERDHARGNRELCIQRAESAAESMLVAAFPSGTAEDYEQAANIQIRYLHGILSCSGAEK